MNNIAREIKHSLLSVTYEKSKCRIYDGFSLPQVMSL